MKRIKMNNEGQTSLDFLIGVTIFLLAFIFIYAFIPGMFTPFNSNSDVLTMTADKVAATLVDDTLVKDTLADGTSCSKAHGIIDRDKIYTLKGKIENADKTISVAERESLGLTKMLSDGTKTIYGFEVVIEMKGQAPITINSGEPKGNYNIGQSRRFIIVRNPDTTLADPVEYPGAIGTMTVRVW